LVAIALLSIHAEPLFFFFLFTSRSAGLLLGHAGASLAGNDSSDASLTGSTSGHCFCCRFTGFGLRCAAIVATST